MTVDVNNLNQDIERALTRALIYLRVSTKEQAQAGGEAEGTRSRLNERPVGARQRPSAQS